MEMEFEERHVTKKGTFYCNFIEDSDHIKSKDLKLKEEELKQLKGQRVSINGKESTVLDTVVESFCNLINRRYYAVILTDEEYEEIPINYQI